jgi:cytoskeletal protein CcmA (bactofilin family)
MSPQSPADVPVGLPEGAVFVGPVHLTGPARIDGHVDGEVFGSECVWIGASASLKARIRAPQIIVDGQIEGVVEASERLELRETARVNAEVRTPMLVLAEGAILEGRCSTRNAETAVPGANSHPISP